MAIGEAAGVTASFAAREETAMADVSVDRVQQHLRETGAVLE